MKVSNSHTAVSREVQKAIKKQQQKNVVFYDRCFPLDSTLRGLKNQAYLDT